MDSTIKVLIYNKRGISKEYTTESVAIALDEYIKNELKFENGFGLSEAAWESIKKAVITTQTPTYVLVELINGLCKNTIGKITKVITQNYPLD